MNILVRISLLFIISPLTIIPKTPDNILSTSVDTPITTTLSPQALNKKNIPSTTILEVKKLYNEIKALQEPSFFQTRKVFSQTNLNMFFLTMVLFLLSEIITAVHESNGDKKIIAKLTKYLILLPLQIAYLRARTITNTLKHINSNLFPKEWNSFAGQKEILEYKILLKKILSTKGSAQDASLCFALLKQFVFVLKKNSISDEQLHDQIRRAKNTYDMIMNMPQPSSLKGRVLMPRFKYIKNMGHYIELIIRVVSSRVSFQIITSALLFAIPLSSLFICRIINKCYDIPPGKEAEETYKTYRPARMGLIVIPGTLAAEYLLYLLARITHDCIKTFFEFAPNRTIMGNLKYINGNLFIEDNGKVIITQAEEEAYKQLLRKILVYQNSFSKEEKILFDYVISKLSLVERPPEKEAAHQISDFAATH